MKERRKLLKDMAGSFGGRTGVEQCGAHVPPSRSLFLLSALFLPGWARWLELSHLSWSHFPNLEGKIKFGLGEKSMNSVMHHKAD